MHVILKKTFNIIKNEIKILPKEAYAIKNKSRRYYMSMNNNNNNNNNNKT